jgi:hypothetical protein
VGAGALSLSERRFAAARDLRCGGRSEIRARRQESILSLRGALRCITFVSRFVLVACAAFDDERISAPAENSGLFAPICRQIGSARYNTQ